MFPVQFVIFCYCNFRFFSFSFISWHRGNVVLRYLLGFRSKTLTSKNAFWPHTQKLRARMLSPASSPVIADLYCSCSPVNGINLTSTLTSLHTSLSMFAVKSWISFWRSETNRPFLQLILCWKPYLEPHAHVVGKLIKGYLRYKTITSQNMSSEAQIKNFFILQKCSGLKIFKFLY